MRRWWRVNVACSEFPHCLASRRGLLDPLAAVVMIERAGAVKSWRRRAVGGDGEGVREGAQEAIRRGRAQDRARGIRPAVPWQTSNTIFGKKTIANGSFVV